MRRRFHWILLAVVFYLISVCFIACNSTGDGGPTNPSGPSQQPDGTQDPSSTAAGTIYIDPNADEPDEKEYLKVDEWSDNVTFASAAGLVHKHDKCRKNDGAVQGVEALYGNTNHFASTLHKLEQGSSASFKFCGTSVRILSYKGADNTSDAADIYIDGIFYKKLTESDLKKTYSSSQGGSVIFEVYGLEDKEHTVKIVNSSSTKTGYIFIDRFEFVEGEDGGLDTEKTQWTISSGDSQMVVVIKGHSPYIAYLGTKSAQRTMIGEESKLNIPTSFEIGSKKVTASWSYVGKRDYSDTVNGVKVNGLILQFNDDQYQLTYNLYIVIRKDLNGPFEIYSELVNNSTNNVRIYTGSFFALTLGKKNLVPSAWYFAKESGYAEGFKQSNGQIKSGTGVYTRPITTGAKVNAWCNVSQDHNTNGFFPMIYLDYNSQYGVYLALEANAGRINAEGLTDGSIKLSSDMDNVDYPSKSGAFSTMIYKGSTFEIPPVYLGVYDGDVDNGSNVFKSWFFNCKSPESMRTNAQEPYTQMDMQQGNNVASLGIQSIKWDYGWWSNEGTAANSRWKTLEGSWVVRSETYINVMKNQCGANSLAKFAADTKWKGVPSLTLYLLLHDTVDKNGNPVTEYGEFNSATNPSWFATNRKITAGMGNSADLGNVDCVEYCKDTLLDFFKGNGVTTWRTDFEPVTRVSNRQNRHDANGTDVQYWASKGLCEIMEHLIENYSSFRYESCSSGGGMKDFLTARYSSAINIDDASNYLDMRMTFYDSSYCLPPAQLHTFSNISRFDVTASSVHPKYYSSQISQDALFDMGFRSIMLGGPKISCDNYSSTVKAHITEYMNLYNQKVKPLVRNAELYHILPRPDGKNWDGVMYADPDTKNEIKGLVFLFKPSSDGISNTQLVKLDGLDPDKTYSLVFQDRPAQNTVKSGKDLMNTGINVTIEGIGSELIWIYEQK